MNLFTITPDWVTAIATMILVLATCVYAYFSYKLTRETIKLREGYSAGTRFIAEELFSNIKNLTIQKETSQ